MASKEQKKQHPVVVIGKDIRARMDRDASSSTVGAMDVLTSAPKPKRTVHIDIPEDGGSFTGIVDPRGLPSIGGNAGKPRPIIARPVSAPILRGGAPNSPGGKGKRKKKKKKGGKGGIEPPLSPARGVIPLSKSMSFDQHREPSGHGPPWTGAEMAKVFSMEIEQRVGIPQAVVQLADQCFSGDKSPQCPLHAGEEECKSGVHPLGEWVLHYDKRVTQQQGLQGYQANLKTLGSVSTVEEFWHLHNHVIKPSEMDMNTNMHFFKEGISPTWEDPANTKGGKWSLAMKGQNAALDRMWEWLVCNNDKSKRAKQLLALIGGVFEGVGDEICGAVVQNRKHGRRMSLWHGNKDAKKAVMKLGRMLTDVLGDVKLRVPLEYHSHSEAIGRYVKQ